MRRLWMLILGLKNTNLQQKIKKLSSVFIERFAIEYCKTKTGVVTLANHERHKQCNEPIRTQSRIIHVTGAKRGKMHASEAQLVMVLLLIG